MFIKYPHEFEFLFNFAVSVVTLDFIYLSSIKCPSLSNTISDRLLLLNHSKTFSKKLKITADLDGALNNFPASCVDQPQCYASDNKTCQLEY
jgi:hypothetical protein